MKIISIKTYNVKTFGDMYLPGLSIFFANPINYPISVRLITPCFISILFFIGFLSGSIITLTPIASFMMSALSKISYASGVIFMFRTTSCDPSADEIKMNDIY